MKSYRKQWQEYIGDERPSWEKAREYVGIQKGGLVGNAHFVEGHAREYNFVIGAGITGIGAYQSYER